MAELQFELKRMGLASKSLHCRTAPYMLTEVSRDCLAVGGGSEVLT